jgi:Cu-Zn family superoxide dismutase
VVNRVVIGQAGGADLETLMRFRLLTLVTALAVAGSSGALSAQGRPASTPKPAAPAAEEASATLLDRRGRTVGSAQFQAGADGVLITVTLAAEGLEPRWHGLHLHAVGTCAGPFTSAGPHVHDGPAGRHGLLNPLGPEAGDLPNLYVDRDGTAEAQFHTTRVRLRASGGGAPALLDRDGSALVLHAEVDDQKTQPIGGSGDRIACGVIKPAR